jgi:hypothetical protein
MLLQSHPTIHKPHIKAYVTSRDWWSKVEGLCALLEPFTQVIMAVQRDQARLADLTRYWLFLITKLSPLLPAFPKGEGLGLMLPAACSTLLVARNVLRGAVCLMRAWWVPFSQSSSGTW